MVGELPHVRVPVGREAERWVTGRGRRRVLLVVHNVTSATRLLDVLPLFADDGRVQLLATCTGSSPFPDGVPRLLESAGLPVLPWRQAVRTPVDLAVAASYGGQLHAIRGKLAVLSHGAGYNKKLAPAASGQRPAASGQRPAASGQRPAASGQRPAARPSVSVPSGCCTTVSR
ncbi:hypothetical protein RM780_05430 [Streptomyces sp. DSM 44917]|uniref:Uncharacterized protein n=1 Tax=Streptomyces boetiae TaxID=3075541 RepID=A0ABU2L501_9ACTN|nr:hypothetical protein [Streptomyces sp. DSM 44917]MDT0306403.1 hypothetical protein [Streptomyces sp. DSM 44917]